MDQPPSSKVEIPQHDINNYREAFRLFDEDKTGTITLENLKEVLESFGYSPSEQEISARVNEIDHNGTGQINFERFIEFVNEEKHHCEEDEMVNLFHVFDLDKSGYIYKHELKIILERLGFIFTEKQVEGMLEFADIKGDGRISYEEFLKANDVRIHKLPKKRERVMSFNICDEDIEVYKDAFRKSDINNTGHVNVQGLKEALKHLAYYDDDEEVEKRLKNIQQNQTRDHVNFDEFVAVADLTRSEMEEIKIITEFKKYDLNNNGFVPEAELQAVLKHSIGIDFTLKQIKAMLQFTNTHDDSMVNYKEFMTANSFRLHKRKY